MKKAMKSGFTLIELLVVVAIIAIIGAGVAVTYNRLDERAKVAMEINDIGELTQTIKNWSFLHDGALPNKLDSLITTDGSLYSAMASAMTTGEIGNGLGMQAGFTFVAANANEDVVNALNTVGIDTVYMHLTDRTPANDSTFRETSSGRKMMDTSETLAILDEDGEDTLLRAQAMVDQNTAAIAALSAGDSYNFTWTDSDGNDQTTVYSAIRAWMMAEATAEEVVEAGGNRLDTLAFIYPNGGTAMAMNLANEIIVTSGMNPDLVAEPTMTAEDAVQEGKLYWVVVFGLGRFTTLYDGHGARVDQAVAGKRYTAANYYNRYLMVVKVPVTGYDSMTGQNEQKACLAAILSPIGLTKTRLDNTYRDTVDATNN